jgi:hypothetical protein
MREKERERERETYTHTHTHTHTLGATVAGYMSKIDLLYG